MRLTVAGSPGDQVVVTDIAIVTLKRPMTSERAMNMQFAVLGGLAQSSQDKKADQEAAKLSPRAMDSIRGVVECKASEVPVELTGSVGWPSVGAGMIATIYRKEEFRRIAVSVWRGIRFALRTSPKTAYMPVPMWHIAKVRSHLKDAGYPLEG